MYIYIYIYKYYERKKRRGKLKNFKVQLLLRCVATQQLNFKALKFFSLPRIMQIFLVYKR